MDQPASKFRLGSLSRALHSDWILLLIVLSFSGFILYKSLLFQPLWLDETVTFWVIKDSWLDTFQRSLHYQGQSPLYFLLVHGLIQLLPATEFNLRLLSLLGILSSAALVYLISRQLFDRIPSVLALITFLAQDEIARSLNARANALALTFSLAATLCLLRWIRTGSTRLLLYYCALMLVGIYMHYLFAAIILVHLCFVLHANANGARRLLARFIAAAFSVAVLSIPGIFQLKNLAARAATYGGEPPALTELFLMLFPVAIIAAFIASILFATICFSGIGWRKAAPLSIIFPVLAWYLSPVLFFAVTKLTGGALFFQRYFPWSCAAPALLLAFLLHNWGTRARQLVTLVAFSIIVADLKSISAWSVDEWDQISPAQKKFLANNTGSPLPTIAFTNLMEDDLIDWYGDPEKRSFLLSPFSYYPISGEPILVPSTLETEQGQQYLKQTLQRVFMNSDGFLFVCRRLATAKTSKGVLPVNIYYDELFKSYGFKGEQLTDSDIVRLVYYKKSS